MDGKGSLLVTAQNSLQLLKLFTSWTPELGVCEMSHLTGFSKSMVSRMVSTFVEESILEKNIRSGKYRLSPVMLEAGLAAEEADPVIQSSRAMLDRLHLETGCDASLYVREENEAICLYLAGDDDEASCGQCVELSHLVSGWAMLAYLEDEPCGSLQRVGSNTPVNLCDNNLVGKIRQIERYGFASGIEPLHQNLYTLSCPIFSDCSHVAAAVSITTGVSNRELCESFLPVLGKSAQMLSKVFSPLFGLT